MGEFKSLPLAKHITSGFKMVIFSMSNRRVGEDPIFDIVHIKFLILEAQVWGNDLSKVTWLVRGGVEH